MGERKLVPVWERMFFDLEVVVGRNGLGDSDKAGCAEESKFAEEIAELVLEEVFEDSAVCHEHGSWRGVGPEPAEKVTLMEIEPG